MVWAFGMGCGRDRSGSGDARAALFLPNARGDRCPLTGSSQEGVTATDLTLRITELLRKEKVVGKFVEFFGEGAADFNCRRSRDDRQHGA